MKNFPWNQLPDDLKAKVFSRLPFESLFCLRSVSKGWKSLLTSRPFLRLLASEWSQNPCLILCPSIPQMPSLVYSFLLQSWQTLTLTLTLPLPFSETNCSFHYLATTSGLLLGEIYVSYPFTFSNPNRRLLFVCNPLTHAFRQFTDIPNGVTTVMAAGITDGDGDKGYKVIILGESIRKTVEIHLYDSTVRSWRRIRAVLSETVAVGNRKMVFCAGKFYCMIFRPPGILVIDVHGDDCTVLPMPEGIDTWIGMMTCGGSVVVAGGIKGLGGIDSLEDVIMWQYCCPTWQEIGRMGGALCEVFERSRWKLDCVGVGDNVCFIDYVGYNFERILTVLVYNTTIRSWKWMPINSICGNNNIMFLHSLPFQPRFDMEV